MRAATHLLGMMNAELLHTPYLIRALYEWCATMATRLIWVRRERVCAGAA